MQKLNRKSILDGYVNLARKLGKIPSRRDVERLLCSERQINKHFGPFSEFKAEAVKEYPELLKLEVPVSIGKEDVLQHRISIEAKKKNGEKKTLVETLSSLEYIEKFAEEVFGGKIKPFKAPKKSKIERTHTLILSDLHIGADIKGDRTGTGVSFSKLEESRRLAAVVKQASEYKIQYRSKSKLVIAILGDIIENNMHDARTGDELAMQQCRAIHLLSQAIAYLASTYPEVEVVCATGNHDRNTSRHHGRAIHGKVDSYSTVIYYALKYALKNVKHVKFTIPQAPISSYDVYGMKIGYTHGDTVIKTGSVYSTIKIKDLSHDVNKINAALPELEEYKAMLYGHTHVAHVVHLPNGCALIGNGALPPPDDFAASIGAFETNNVQWMFESVPGISVGDMRGIRCGKEYDRDEKLDKIIKPFGDLNSAD